MRGLSRVLEQLIELSGVHLKPWMAPALALLVGALFLPSILRNEHTRRARKKVAELSLARGSDLAERREEILALVEGNPHGLAAVADEALRRGRQDLARLAILRCAAAGGDPAVLHVLRRKLDGDRRAMVLEAELAAIERFADDGLWLRAEERLAESKEAFPDDERLAALAGRIARRERGGEEG